MPFPEKAAQIPGSGVLFACCDDDLQQMRRDTIMPAGQVFLMGDNRGMSADSRVLAEYSGLGGTVPIENIGGRAEIVTFSLDGSATWNPLSQFTMFRSGRVGTSLNPWRIRPRRLCEPSG